MNSNFNDLLKQTSRSFYLTMRILPGPIRHQISLAYLLARTSDTIADTEILAVDRRLQALTQFRERIAGVRADRLELGELARSQALPQERLLLERCEEALEMLPQLSDADQERVREVLKVILSGQELDLRRFAQADEDQIVALETDAELDDYTYRVAGCVGEFWTRICQAHLFPQAPMDQRKLIENGVRFGKGLQLINILRDLPKDLRNGRCYLPRLRLEALGLQPEELLLPKNEGRFRPLYNEYLAVAHAHLAAGWQYTNTLPKKQTRLRLACAWPILIGQKTLEKLREATVLDPAERVKITRPEVRQILLRSILSLWRQKRWESQFSQ